MREKEIIEPYLVPPEAFGKMIEHLSRFVVVNGSMRESDLEEANYLEIPVYNDNISYSTSDEDFAKINESRTFRRDFYVKKTIVIFGKTFFGWSKT